VDKTFMFEFINSERPVVTKYQQGQVGLYLIGVRDLDTLIEFNEDLLDWMGRVLWVGRPRRWNCGSLNEVQEFLAEFPDDFEGFVLRERDTGERAKIKKKEYLLRHRLIGQTSYRNLIPLWLAGETSEIACYLPETADKFAAIYAAFEKAITRIADSIEPFRGFATRKDMAFAMERAGTPATIRSFAFHCFDLPAEEMEVAIGRRLIELGVDRIIELLGLNDQKDAA
jgi:hypothetical protein